MSLSIRATDDQPAKSAILDTKKQVAVEQGNTRSIRNAGHSQHKNTSLSITTAQYKLVRSAILNAKQKIISSLSNRATQDQLARVTYTKKKLDVERGYTQHNTNSVLNRDIPNAK